MYPVKGKKKKKKSRTIKSIRAQVSAIYRSRYSTHLNDYECEKPSSPHLECHCHLFFFFWKTSSLGNLNNAPFFPCGRLDILYWVESRIPLIVTGPWRGGNAGVCSLCVPLVFLTSIDPPAFRPRRCMNRMKAALEEPVTDIMSPQTFIKMPFILLLGPP